MNLELIEWLKDKNLTSNLEEIILRIDDAIYSIAEESRLGNSKDMRISYGPSNSNKRSNLILFPKKGLNTVRVQIKKQSYEDIDSEFFRNKFSAPTIREHGKRFVELEVKYPLDLSEKLIDFLKRGVNQSV